MTRKFIALMCLVSLHVTQAFAEDYKVGSLAIETPWTRATPNDAKVAAGYMKIVNSGKIDDHLVGGSTTIAGKVEIHEMSMVDNVMKMRQLPGGLDLKPGQSVELKPGSYHVMFIDLKRQLKPGEKFMATLQFQKAGPIDVQFVVNGMGSMNDMHKMDGMEMKKN